MYSPVLSWVLVEAHPGKAVPDSARSAAAIMVDVSFVMVPLLSFAA
jgi:hypothetical protein